MARLSSPSLLLECSSPIEAAAIKSLLQQHGIEAIIQTENVSALLPHLQAIIPPRLLVAAADFERAETVLEGFFHRQTQENPLEGGLCAVHEAQAIATCARCGSFLCAQCGSLGTPPVCESCVAAEALPARASPLRPYLALLIGASLVTLLLVTLARLLNL